ncbi:MAG: O-antigen ligase family protein [Chloroflexi bacterium]|nr:O-antigen ligase family protein [Chloroflexota bacterium]
MAVAMASPPALLARLAQRLTAWEPLVLLALVPLSWSGSLLSLVGVPLLALLLAARWQAGRPVRSGTLADRWLLLLLTTLPLTVLPVVDWRAAAPRFVALLLGIAMLVSVARWVTSEQRAVAAACGLVLTGGAAFLLSPVLADWPAYKTPLLPQLEGVYRQMPLLVSGVIRGTPRGGIHVNQLAGTATLLLPLGCALGLTAFQRREWRSRRWLVSLSVLVVVVGLAMLLLSQSRSGYLGALVGLAVLGGWWALRLPRWWRLGAVLAGGSSVSVVGWMMAAHALRWLGTSEPSVDSFLGRLELWNRASLMLLDFPFTGIGPGQFSLFLHHFYTPLLITPEEYIPHAHNVVLQLGLDLGIPGGLAVLGLIVQMLWRLARTGWRAASPVGGTLALGIVAGLLGFLCYGLTDAIALTARGALVLWVLLGLGAALDRLARAPR